MRAIIGAVLWLITAAASAAPPDPAVASCNNIAAKGSCMEYRLAGTGLSAMKDACARTTGAVWAEKACPTEKRVAHCAYKGMTGTVANYYPPVTLEKAREKCAATFMEDFSAN